MLAIALTMMNRPFRILRVYRDEATKPHFGQRFSVLQKKKHGAVQFSPGQTWPCTGAMEKADHPPP